MNVKQKIGLEMSMIRSLGLLVAIFGITLIQSCGTKDGEKYVLAQKIYIKYSSDAKSGDWIKIDGLKFMHMEADTFGQGANENFNYTFVNADTMAKYKDVIFLPTTDFYDNGAGTGVWLYTPASSAEIAKALVEEINIATRDPEDVLLEKKIYGFEGNQLTISTGAVTIFRRDGQKIKVSTSDNYPAYVGNKSFEDYIRSQAQKKK
jgi:hypothetical protein